MIQYLVNIDRQLFLFFNGFHSPFFDSVFTVITTTVTWIPLFALLIFFFIKKYKKQSVYVILGVIVLVACTDLVSARIFKPVFMRPRPCHDPLLSGLVHTVNGKCGGQYGFISSHAANLFGIATYSFFALKRFYKYTWLLFVWAAIIGYSRVYLGVHFPADVALGTVFGVLLGWGVWTITWYICRRQTCDA